MRTSIALSLTFALTACGGNNTPLHSDTGDPPQATDSPTSPSDTVDTDLLPLPGTGGTGGTGDKEHTDPTGETVPTGKSHTGCVDTACDTDLPFDTCDSADTCLPIDPPWDSGCGTANSDTGCQPDPCALTFEITTASWASEMSIDIEDRHGSVVAEWPPSGITPSNNSSYTWTVHVEPDDITIALLDSFGDGWNGGYVTVTDSAGNVIASTTATDFTAGSRYEIDHRHDCGGTFTVDSGDSDTFRWPSVAPCTMEFSWNAISSWTSGDAFFSVYDEEGNELFTETFDNATSWTHEEAMASGNYYAVMHYDYPYGTLTNPFDVTELATNSPQASLTMDLAGYDWEWFTVDCSEDTAWTGQETDWETPASDELPPELPAFWTDTQDTLVNGTCTFLLQMVGPNDDTWPYDYTLGQEISWYLYDDEQNILDRMTPGEVSTNQVHERPVTLDAGRYLFHLQDSASDGWEGGYLRVVTPDGDIIENLTLDSGAEDHVYLDLDCEGVAYTGWDTASVPTNDSAWWAPKPHQGCPMTLAMNTAGHAYEMEFVITDTVTGATVFSSYNTWPTGVPESSSPQYTPLALPSGSYELELIEDSTYYNGWYALSWVRLHDENGSFLTGGGLTGTTGSATYPFTWSCTTDSALWTDSAIVALRDDSGWSMGPGWYDSAVPGTCGHMVEVLTPYSPLGGGWEIYDDAGTLLYSVTPGSMTQPYAAYHTPVQLPSGAYRFRMIDTAGNGYAYAGIPENFRLFDDGGQMIDSFGMGGWGVSSAEEWFIVDCEDDSGWHLSDTAWCEPIDIDTASGSLGDACATVIEVVASYDYQDMGVRIEDDVGHVLFELLPGDLTAAGTHYFAFAMPTGGYHVILEDAAGYNWSSTASVSILSGSGCVDTADTLHGPWRLDYSNTQAIGGQWDTWFEHTCDADTATWAGWDSGWCEPILDSGEISTGACGYVVAVRAGYDYYDMQITIEDSDGNQVFQVAAGDLTAEDMYYFPVNLPTDGYTITWSDESLISEYWDPDAWFQIIPVDEGSTCLDLAYEGTERYTLPPGYGGERTEYEVLNCAEDTADTDFQWDSGWCQPITDTTAAVSGACGYLLEVRADYDYYDMVIELSDSDGNQLVDVQAGDLTSSGYHYFPVNLPSDGYHLHLEDASSWSPAWGSNAHVRLVPADGLCMDEQAASETFTVTEFGELDEYFIIDCAEDSGDTFSWDSGWCEPIIDTADMPTGDCGYVLEVASDFDYYAMGIHITDADGTDVIDIAAGDITAEGRTFHPINLGTNGYTMTLTDSAGSGNWGPDAYVRLIPVDGSCVEDADIEAAATYRVDTNGEEVIHFEVDCADDSATFGWDSGWCDTLLSDTAALIGCEQLIDVSTYYGYQMGIEIEDSNGNIIFDIDYNELGYYSQYFYVLHMPTGGYQITLTDSLGNGWEDWGTYAPGSLTIWEGNGVCAGEEALFGPYTLPDTNGDTGLAANEATFNLWVDCDADTSTDTEDTTWMGDSDWAPTSEDSAAAP